MKGFKDTSLGAGGGQRFPTTIWNDVLAAADKASPRNREQLERLLRAYWRPVYLHVRLAWRKSVEDAKDLTQAFFSHLLEKEFLAQLRPELGSFRGYLKRSLTNFVIDAERSAATRRPEGRMFSLEAGPRELEAIGPATPDETADQAWDREWFDALFKAALAQFKETLEKDNKALYYEAFRIYCLEPASRPDGGRGGPTYRDVGAELRLKETDVRNYLTYSRRLLQQILRERIREYALTEEEVQGELLLALRF